MHQFIDLPFGRVGAFPLCVGLGLSALVLLVLYGSSRCSFTAFQVNERLVPALPFCLLFGVAFSGLTETFFHDGIRAVFRHPFGCGVNYFGWFIGCVIFLSAFGRLMRMSVRELLEVFVPACLPAQAIGRIGCFLGGCCYGRPVALAWGVVYPDGSIPFSAYGAEPLFPVQLCEAGWLFIVFVVVMTAVRQGCRAGASLMAMGAGRFVLEFMRGDPRGSLFRDIPLSPAQCLSVALFVVGALVWASVRSKTIQVGSGESPTETSGEWHCHPDGIAMELRELDRYGRTGTN